MKKSLISYLLSLISYMVLAQSNVNFNKIYTVIPGNACYSQRVAVYPDGYELYGETEDSTNTHVRISVTKIDTLGNLVWNKSYGKSSYDYFFGNVPGGGEGVSVPWGGYIEAGFLADTTSSWIKAALFRFDNNGDTVWTKGYTDSTYEVGITVRVTREKQYIMGGEWTNYSGSNNFTTTLKKTDTLGNTIWQKTYQNLPGHLRESLALDTCKDDGYIIAAWDVNFNYSCSASIFVLKTDSAGTPQWTHYLTNPVCSVGPGYVLSLRDGSYLVCGSYSDSIEPINSLVYGKLYLTKISNTGNIKWAKQYGEECQSAGLNSIKELPNGDIVACGCDSSNYMGCILKTDSNGNQKWLRYYEMQSPQEQDYLYDIQLLSDGGYVAVGQTYGNTQNIWVVKTDSLGCDTIGCNYATRVGEVKGVSEEVKVYPNPANGNLTIAYSLNNSPREVNLIMYDVLGNKVADWTLPSGASAHMVVSESISSLAPGMYFYTIFEDNKVVQRNKLVIER